MRETNRLEQGDAHLPVIVEVSRDLKGLQSVTSALEGHTEKGVGFEWRIPILIMYRVDGSDFVENCGNLGLFVNNIPFGRLVEVGGRRPREGNDERVDDLNGQGNNQGLGANGDVKGVNGNVEGVNGGVGNQGNIGNQNGNVVNENVQENVGNVLVNGNRAGCSYKELLACNPKEYDCKGVVVVFTRWIEKMENVRDMSGCSVDQKVKYIAGSFVESNSPEFDHNFNIEEQLEEEVRETMTETMEQYMSKTRGDYGSGVTRPSINQDTHFELKGQFLKELRDNTFSGSEHEDANEHIEKVLEIVDLFHILKITQDQIMLQAFPVSLTGAASIWLRNQPSGSITTCEVLKTKFLNKYCPPARTAKKMEEINNFQQEPDESLFRAWERFKELLMKCPQHYLTNIQEVILFYNGLDVPTRQIMDSKGAIPSKTATDAKITIQEMVEYSQKWHNGTSSRTRSTETSDGLAAIQAQLNNLGREIKKVNEKVYASQFGAPYQLGGQYIAAGPVFYQRNNGNTLYLDRRTNLEESLTKFMAESTKRHEENSNIINGIRASTDATIRNQGASIKTIEIQIIKMSKVLQERGFGSLPSSTETNPQDQVKAISTTKAGFFGIHQIGCGPYAREAQDVKILDAYDHTLPQKEKDPRRFTLPYFIYNIYFDKALVDLGASVSVMPFSTYTNLGLLTLDFIILDIPEDDDVPLILGRPFLSTAHSKIDVFKRKITLRVGEEKLVFKSFTIIDDDDMTKDIMLGVEN
ncbi:hypothetical protein Tco_1055968 [Tanacetum coccineum]|uniref:Retrotransposon gag domain-containing protein n=1 Tax=Tanacetum coccineum TaxID=301880 RepID=A0ABQ5H2B9_9ASTR